MEKEVKLSLFADDMILHPENPKNTTKILDLIYEFNKSQDKKINVYTEIIFSTITMINQKENLSIQSYLPLQQKE